MAEDVFDAAARGHASVTDGAELYLACACATGSADAIRAFEARYFTCILPVVRRIGLPDDDANEIAQTLRQRLFVGGERASVVDYAGRGQLGGLVQVAATRIALNLKRSKQRIADEPPAEVPVVATDTVYAKAEYRDHIKRAIEAAAAALGARDKTLLRMHLLERKPIDDIATVYRVHRATAARWVQAARETLIANTRDHFADAAKLAPDPHGGLASFVESQLTLSLSRILR